MSKTKINSFNDDLLSLSAFGEELSRIIAKEKESVTGSLVVGLAAGYGSGKTTFLNMWEDSIDKDPDIVPPVPKFIKINAWEDDYIGEPLYGIVSALVEVIEKEEDKSSLVLAVKSFGWFTLDLGSQILDTSTGINVREATEFVKSQNKESIENSGSIKERYRSSDAFTVFKRKKEAMLSLKEAIQTAIKNYGGDIYFLVDELDRCRPDYAISFLETIKHIFDIERAVFILAYDRQQLESSAKVAFGDNLNFNEYIRKFMHRELSLPNRGFEQYMELVGVNFKLLDDKNLSHMEMKNVELHHVSLLMTAFKITPRQLQEIFRIHDYIFRINGNNFNMKGADKKFKIFGYFVLALIAIKFYDLNLYTKLSLQKFDDKEVLNLLEHCFQDEKSLKFWFIILSSSLGYSYNEDSYANFVKSNSSLSSSYKSAIGVYDRNHAKLEFQSFQSDWANDFKNYYAIDVFGYATSLIDSAKSN